MGGKTFTRITLGLSLMVGVACAQASTATHPNPAPPAQDASNGTANQAPPGPQTDLRQAFVAAQTIYMDNGKSFQSVTPEAMAATDGGLCYASDSDTAGSCGDGGDVVFIAARDQLFGAATSDGSGGCLWISNQGGSQVGYGSGAECSGRAAFDATGSSWGH